MGRQNAPACQAAHLVAPGIVQQVHAHLAHGVGRRNDCRRVPTAFVLVIVVWRSVPRRRMPLPAAWGECATNVLQLFY